MNKLKQEREREKSFVNETRMSKKHVLENEFIVQTFRKCVVYCQILPFALLNKIPQIFKKSKGCENCLGGALTYSFFSHDLH